MSNIAKFEGFSPAEVSKAKNPAVVTEHFGEFHSLWSMRQNVVTSPDWFPHDLAKLEDRIRAHLEGLLVAGNSVVPLLEEHLSADEPAVTFASAYVLLCLNSEPARQLVMDTFLQASGGQLAGIRDALGEAPGPVDVERLESAIKSASAEVAVAAAHVLATHGQLHQQHTRWLELLSDEDPGIRCSAWQVVAMGQVRF